MGPPKRPVSRELPSRGPFLIDVPTDDSCLFWSTALAYLIPVKDNNDAFQQRYTTLFGDREIRYISHVRELIQNYNPLLNEVPSDDILKDLVSNTFRNRVVDHIQSHEDKFRGFISSEFFQYLNDMRKPDTWGGQPEIMAMSEMLGAKVTVSGVIQSEYDNGDIPIQLFHVSTIEEGKRNHYNFGLPQNIVDAYRDNVENIPGQRSFTKSDRRNIADQRSSTKPELIELLLTKPINTGNDNGNLVLPKKREEPIGFDEKFSLFLEETPCVGSASKREFFTHAILGSVLTPPSSGLEQNLGIKNVYIKHDINVERNRSNAKVVLSDIIKLCFVLEKDGKKQIALRVFVNDETINYENLEDKHHYSDSELKEIAGKLDISDINSVDEHVFLIGAKKDQDGSSFELHTKQINEVEKRFKAVASSPSPSQTDEFKKVKMDKSASLERVFQGLSNEEVQEVQDSAKRIFRSFIKIHKNNREEFSLFDSEAADHGFVYGASALNFKYRYGLNCYVERAGGSGRADLIFMSRTKDGNGIINPKPIPVVVEFKGSGHTASEAIKQIKDKGYLYNLSVRTRAENAVIVGVSFASMDALQVEQDVIFQSKGFVQRLLEGVKKLSENDVSGIQNNLKEELENLYHVIPSHGRHYLSKVILGQVLAAEEGVKYIFTYGNEDKSIGKEATTFVLFNGDKAVILNIIEHAGGQRQTRRQKGFDDNKIPPIDESKINFAVKVDVEIDVGAKSKIVAFEVQDDKSKSYYQDIKIEKVSDINSKDKYHGKFQKIKEVEVDKIVKGLEELDFKDKFQWTKKTDSKLKELLSPLKEALFAHKELIKNEVDFRAILQGLFMSKKGEDDEEVKVYAETSISSKGRIDLALSCAIPKSDGSFEESYPIIIELKYARSKTQVETKLEEAKEQSDKKYNLVKSFTNKRTAKFLVMVFDEKAENADELIVASTRDFIVEHTSQSETDSQTVVDSPPLDFGIFPLSEGSLNSEHTDSPSDGKQRLDEFDFQEDSSSLDNLSLVPQVGSSDGNRELDKFDFQENSLLSQRRKRKRSPEPYREQERSVKSDLDDVSVQSHLTRTKDLGLG